MRRVPAILLLCLCLTPLATAQSVTGQDHDRLFLSFIEDTARADRQWWEGQIQVIDADSVDITALVGVVAMTPWERFEVGGRVGFADSDTNNMSLSDGSGATDLDVWGKYYIGSTSSTTEWTVGGVATIPTGDDTAGLGYDAFSLSVFGAMRTNLRLGTLAINAGMRWNDDGQIFGSPTLDGELQPQIGAGWILPLSDPVSFIAEVDFDGERFDGADSEGRVSAGIHWRATQRGMVRASIAIGLADGSPDNQLLVGYAAQF